MRGENDALKKRLEALEGKNNPPPPDDKDLLEKARMQKEADAKAEGTEKGRLYYYGEPHAIKGSPKCYNTAKEAFKGLWDSLNAKRGYGWDANNWVWVISFRRIAP